MDEIFEQFDIPLRDRRRDLEIRLSGILQKLGYRKKKGQKHPSKPGRTGNVWVRRDVEDFIEPPADIEINTGEEDDEDDD